MGLLIEHSEQEANVIHHQIVLDWTYSDKKKADNFIDHATRDNSNARRLSLCTIAMSHCETLSVGQPPFYTYGRKVRLCCASNAPARTVRMRGCTCDVHKIYSMRTTSGAITALDLYHCDVLVKRVQ